MKKIVTILIAISMLLAVYLPDNILSAQESSYELLDFTTMTGVAVSARTSVEQWGHGVANLIDGDIDEAYRYLSKGGTTGTVVDEWILLDLGDVFTIDKYAFAAAARANGEGMPKSFTISVSHSGKDGTWTQVYEKTGMAAMVDTLIYDFSFESIEARYVKLNVTEVIKRYSATSEIGLREIQVHGTPLGHELFDFTSMHGVSVSARTSRENADMSVDRLIDGVNDSTVYNYMSKSGSTDLQLDEWIVLDLGKSCGVGTFGFATFGTANPAGMPKAFTISVSDTGADGTWTEVFSEDNASPIASTINYYYTFPTVETRYIKFHITEIKGIMGTLYDVRLREIYVKGVKEHKVELTKSIDDFIVSIDGWKADHQYQIWTWQEVASDTFGTMNQWVLSMPYSLGSALTDAGDGTKTVNLGTVFDSPDPYYTVAVKIIDGDGNFAGQLKDTYTPEEIGEVIIEKVDVDGAFVGENAIVKDIDGGNVGIEVYTNITDGITYSAVVTPSNPGDPILTPIGNTFNWDVSALAPGMYSVKLTTQNGASSDERTIKFNLYKVDETINYGRMDSIGVTGTPDSGAGAFRINIAPTVPQGEWVTYSISEPWRSAIFSSSSIARTTAVGGITDVNIDENSYGVYQVATYIKRSLSGSTDDGMIRTVENSRGGTKTLDVNVNEALYEGMVSSSTAQQITITPNAVISEIGVEDILYSYWRRDARGWVLIRDYNTTAQLTWTPARVGLYTIQVRVKGSDAGSYEMSKNLEFNITGGDSLLSVDDITLSGTDSVSARTPVTIMANAVNPSSEDVLYKYIISNGFIYYVETGYTADPTYIWTPGKAGNYSISVLVKNEASYGKYDEIKTFSVTVN